MNNLNKAEVGILIAVRMKSSRLKSKAFGDLVGKPVIVHLIERMKRVKNAGRIVVCTSTHADDQVLLEMGQQEGVSVFAGSEMDVMKRFIDAAEKFGFKTIVRVTGDNPLTDPENIDRMIIEHYEGNYDFTRSEHLPIGTNAEVISVGTLKRAYETAEDTSLTEYMTTYLKRPDIFRVHIVDAPDPFFRERSLIRLTVDYEEDLKVLNAIYQALYKKNPQFTIRDVLEFLDKQPEITRINADVVQIPLPKIFFKGEKKHDKKLIFLCNEMNAHARQIVQAIRQKDEYDIVGLFHNSPGIEYSLIENIPVLGRCVDIDKLKVDADFFYSALSEGSTKSEFESKLSIKGLQKVNI